MEVTVSDQFLASSALQNSLIVDSFADVLLRHPPPAFALPWSTARVIWLGFCPVVSDDWPFGCGI